MAICASKDLESSYALLLIRHSHPKSLMFVMDVQRSREVSRPAPIVYHSLNSSPFSTLSPIRPLSLPL